MNPRFKITKQHVKYVRNHQPKVTQCFECFALTVKHVFDEMVKGTNDYMHEVHVEDNEKFVGFDLKCG